MQYAILYDPGKRKHVLQASRRKRLIRHAVNHSQQSAIINTLHFIQISFVSLYLYYVCINISNE
jgi:hypothetical protein